MRGHARGVPTLSGTAAAAGTSDESGNRRRADELLPVPVLHYRAPAADWERETLPIGCGALGANIWGTLASERLTFNEKTLWTGGPGSAEGYDLGNWTAPRPGALDGNGLRFEAQIRVRATAGTATAGGSLTATGADQAWFFLAAGTDYADTCPDYRGEDPHGKARPAVR